MRRIPINSKLKTEKLRQVSLSLILDGLRRSFPSYSLFNARRTSGGMR